MALFDGVAGVWAGSSAGNLDAFEIDSGGKMVGLTVDAGGVVGPNTHNPKAVTLEAADIPTRFLARESNPLTGLETRRVLTLSADGQSLSVEGGGLVVGSATKYLRSKIGARINLKP